MIPIGILLFISRFTRPDISYSVAYLAGFTGWVPNKTLKAAQRVVKYIYQTTDQAISFTSSSQQELQVFVDASFAPNVDRCLFIKKNSDHTTSFLAVYVDDVLFCSNSEFDREQVPARLLSLIHISEPTRPY